MENPSQETLTQWVREQFQSANKFLAENGIVFDSVAIEECRYMAPLVAVWKITAVDKKAYWVVTGDVPSDFTQVSACASAREALRYFSMQWQAKSASLEDSNNAAEVSESNTLQEAAEKLYVMAEDEKYWAQPAS